MCFLAVPGETSVVSGAKRQDLAIQQKMPPLFLQGGHPGDTVEGHDGPAKSEAPVENGGGHLPLSGFQPQGGGAGFRWPIRSMLKDWDL